MAVSPKKLGPPNFCVKKIKNESLSVVTTPLKFSLRLLQFGMCIVNDICDRLADIFFTQKLGGPKFFGERSLQRNGYELGVPFTVGV